MQPFSFFFLLFVVGGGDFGSGSGFKFNCAARVGSDDLGYGPGSGFSFEPVQTSTPLSDTPDSTHQLVSSDCKT